MARAISTALKRKNIDLPVETLQKLSLIAVSQGKSLKAYIENLLIAKANSITIEIKENPSPSGDTWFTDPDNITLVKKGIAEMTADEGRAYSIEEIKRSLGL